MYINEKSVRDEIRHAMFTFEKGGFTILNVTNKPIESTANEILSLMSQRFSMSGRRLKSPYQR
jgi:regulator of PEP synthase PpsR (kinase-PPPase family)